MTKRRKHHRLPYYEEVLGRITDPTKLRAMLDDAACQPERFLSERDYETLYWKAFDITKGEIA